MNQSINIDWLPILQKSDFLQNVRGPFLKNGLINSLIFFRIAILLYFLSKIQANGLSVKDNAWLIFRDSILDR